MICGMKICTGLTFRRMLFGFGKSSWMKPGDVWKAGIATRGHVKDTCNTPLCAGASTALPWLVSPGS